MSAEDGESRDVALIDVVEDNKTETYSTQDKIAESDVERTTAVIATRLSQRHIVQYAAKPKSAQKLVTGKRKAQAEEGQSRNIACGWQDCAFTSSTISHIQRHKKRHTGEKPFVCLEEGCEYSSARRDNLNAHHCRVHQGEKPFACHECSYTARRRQSFLHHKRKHKGLEDPSVSQLRCDWLDCDFVCTKPSKLKAHKRAHSGENSERNFPCTAEGCNYSAKRRACLRIHISRFHPPDGITYSIETVTAPLTPNTEKQQGHVEKRPILRQRLHCPTAECDYVTARYSCLERHLQEHKRNGFILPVGPQLFSCNWKGCSYATKYRKSLIEHKQAKHLGEKPFPCSWPECPYAALTEKYLTLHMRVHLHPGGKPVKCNLCDKAFSSQSVLREHGKRNHSDILGKGVNKKPCTVPGCSYSTHKKYAMERHMLTHVTERPLECDWRGCDYRTNDKSKLERHKMKHAEKDLVCDWEGCSFRTSFAANMKAHKKNHDGKKYPCSWEGCDFKSTTRTAVKRHMVLHTGERPFECKVCDMSFGFQSSLWLHNKKVHAGEA